ncbi:hypothetical protein HNP25_004388 [Arcicella rosea]|uniref:Uncharacterized protein n=2 Tax=Arcicella rosea TaxID=502909 RepID=A0A841EWA7_9BACT|nr:hypothetical protein [Arcicella rosea]
MEDEWKKIKDTNPSDVFQIEIVPSFSGNSKRPTRFRVEMINTTTKETKIWNILNP